MTTTLTRPAKRPALRFSLQPVMALTRVDNYEQLGVRLGVSGDAVRQWSVRGLSSKQADFVATRLGFHPLNIWSDFNDDLVVDLDDFEDVDDGEHRVEPVRSPAARKRRSRPVASAFIGDRREFLGMN